MFTMCRGRPVQEFASLAHFSDMFFGWCSIKEPGLYDYVIFNDDLEDAFAQLTLVARRALAGQEGNGSGSISGPVTLVADKDPDSAAETSARPEAARNDVRSFKFRAHALHESLSDGVLAIQSQVWTGSKAPG